MKLLKICLFTFSVLSHAVYAHAQTADEIIAKHLEAIGGKEKLEGIKSVQIENTMQIMGNDAPSTTTIVNGKGFRNESEFNGQKMIQVFTDKGGWMVNPMMGSGDPQAIPGDQLKSGQAQIYVVPFLDYVLRGEKAEMAGQEKLGNINAYKIKLTDNNNSTITYYFDPATYYIIEAVRSAEMMGQQMEITTTYSDFKKTDFGWVVPQSTEINMGGQFSMTSKMKSIAVNKEVDEKIFVMPSK